MTRVRRSSANATVVLPAMLALRSLPRRARCSRLGSKRVARMAHHMRVRREGRCVAGHGDPPGHQGVFGLADDPSALCEGRIRRRVRYHDGNVGSQRASHAEERYSDPLTLRRVTNWVKVSSGSPAGERSCRYCFSAWRKLEPVRRFLASIVAIGRPLRNRATSSRPPCRSLYSTSFITERILASYSATRLGSKALAGRK